VDRTAMDHLVGLFDPRPNDSSMLTTALPPEVHLVYLYLTFEIIYLYYALRCLVYTLRQYVLNENSLSFGLICWNRNKNKNSEDYGRRPTWPLCPINKLD